MKLDRLHIAQMGTCFQCHSMSCTFTDSGIGRLFIDPTISACCDHSTLCHISGETAFFEVPDNGSKTLTLFGDERDSFHFIFYHHPLFHRFIGYSIEHGVTCGIGGITGSPLFGTAKVSGINETMGFLFFSDRCMFCIDNNGSIPFFNTIPRYTPCSQFTNGFGSSLNKHSRNLLVATPVAAFDSIGKVDIFIVTFSHNAVSEARLHAALCSCRV